MSEPISTEPQHLTFETGGHPVKAWVQGVEFEDMARDQTFRLAQLPIIHSHVAVMPDTHAGAGATVGTVIATKGAIIPAAVGVDIGCGVVCCQTSLRASDLPDSLAPLRDAIERAVPHGRTSNGVSSHDKGAWAKVPASVETAWGQGLSARFDQVVAKHPKAAAKNTVAHLGTLGTGNHMIELCLDDQTQNVWLMIHSGSRGLGNRFGEYFIEQARQDMGHLIHNLPDRDLAYLTEGTQHFDDYVEAVSMAQDYARVNRELMMQRSMQALRSSGLPAFQMGPMVVNCHHNFVVKENHFGADVYVTRKGAVRAGAGELGVILGSMGARSYIVRGKGNVDSFCTCSHGAGRRMSRTQAKKSFTVQDHELATLGVECRKDEGVLDETPGAYKNIDAVMAAQTDLVDVVLGLKQVLCVKG